MSGICIPLHRPAPDPPGLVVVQAYGRSDRAGWGGEGNPYRHFPSKDDLVIAFLERREEHWTLAWVEAEARRRGTTPEEQLLAIFDLFDEWFHRDDFEACSLIKVLLEMGPAPPPNQASVRHLANIRTVVGRLGEEAALRDPASFARSWRLLMTGSIVSAAEGDAHAAQRAQSMARLLIEQHR